MAGRSQGTSYAHFLACDHFIETDHVVEPVGKGFDTVAPPAMVVIEFREQFEEAIVSGVDLAGEFDDLWFQFCTTGTSLQAEFK